VVDRLSLQAKAILFWSLVILMFVAIWFVLDPGR
jgi:hypothetical protein